MRSVTYHLASTLTVFAAGMGQTQVVRAGKLLGFVLRWSGIAGAGGTFGGSASAMLNQNTTNDTLTNNPPRETILGCITGWAAASAAFGISGPFTPVNVEVRPGDLLTINAGNGGAAAPASSYLTCDFYVQE